MEWRHLWGKTIYEKGGSLLTQAIESSRHLRKVVAPPGDGRCARQDTKIMVRRSVQFPIKGGDVYGPAFKSEELNQSLETHVVVCGADVMYDYGLGFHFVRAKTEDGSILGPGSKAGEALS